jgi:hypothetical protein
MVHVDKRELIWRWGTTLNMPLYDFVEEQNGPKKWLMKETLLLLLLGIDKFSHIVNVCTS